MGETPRSRRWRGVPLVGLAAGLEIIGAGGGRVGRAAHPLPDDSAAGLHCDVAHPVLERRITEPEIADLDRRRRGLGVGAEAPAEYQAHKGDQRQPAYPPEESYTHGHLLSDTHRLRPIIRR